MGKPGSKPRNKPAAGPGAILAPEPAAKNPGSCNVVECPELRMPANVFRVRMISETMCAGMAIVNNGRRRLPAQLLEAGLEPAISSLGGRCLIH